MFNKFKLVWISVSIFSTLLGIGGWPEDAATWHGWINGMNPVLAGFLMGVGMTSLAFFLLVRWGVTSNESHRTGQNSLTHDPGPAPLKVEPESEKDLQSQPKAPQRDRKWCPLTPLELIELARSRNTDLERDVVFESFRDTWFRFGGVVDDVEDRIDCFCVSILLPDDNLTVYSNMNTDLYSKKDFLDLKKGDRLKVEGRFNSASVNRLVFLSDGELIH